jgi:RNA polymerase sigma-70 factor (ECF subfamily)
MLVATAPLIAPREGDTIELDADTLQSCRVGSAAALRVFVTRYERMVFAFLSRSLGPGPHVEDLAQEVFLRACRALPAFDPGGAARPSTWILTIARHVVIDARRKRQVPTTHLGAEYVPSFGTPETERRQAELGVALQRAADTLPDEQRDVFLLAEFHDLAMKEIASVLGVRESTVKTRLFRARERLRVLLREVWEEST